MSLNTLPLSYFEVFIFMANDRFEVREYLDRFTGKAYRIYTYKRRPCVRVQLTSRLAEQMAGYTMIEKDLRSALTWLDEIERRHVEQWSDKKRSFGRAEDRDNYNIVKGLFVALLTFYGKCFSKCEGRPVKLERAQIATRFHQLHDDCIQYRHNFAAHSGAKKIEHVEVALVYQSKYKKEVNFKIFRELHQPDLFWPKSGETSLRELLEHAREKALSKIDLLAEKIQNEEIIPHANKYWSKA